MKVSSVEDGSGIRAAFWRPPVYTVSGPLPFSWHLLVFCLLLCRFCLLHCIRFLCAMASGRLPEWAVPAPLPPSPAAELRLFPGFLRPTDGSSLCFSGYRPASLGLRPVPKLQKKKKSLSTNIRELLPGFVNHCPVGRRLALKFGMFAPGGTGFRARVSFS